jgi:hypothetical protein
MKKFKVGLEYESLCNNFKIKIISISKSRKSLKYVLGSTYPDLIYLDYPDTTIYTKKIKIENDCENITGFRVPKFNFRDEDNDDVCVEAYFTYFYADFIFHPYTKEQLEELELELNKKKLDKKK